jgi:murein DD-endopeptidase MepM/ murein hydrolase activator NlpD
MAVLLALVAWGGAATWVAFSSKKTVAALMDEQAEMRQSYEEKVKALTRRLVGVASHQLLEQDGLEGRMADLIARQVQLENRQAMLTAVTEQATGAPFTALDTGSAAVKPSEPAPGVLRLGAPPPDPPGTANAFPPRSGASAPATGPASEPRTRAPGSSSLPARPMSELPLREQFARLENSMARVGTAQVRSLNGLLSMSQGQAVLIRSALGELGLDLDKLSPGSSKLAMGGPFVPLPAVRDPFELAFQHVQRVRLFLEQLKPVTEIVPLRRPIEGENNLASNFGPRTDPFTGVAAMHAGMDFRSRIGTPVHATGRGRVVTADVSGGYGNLVEIDHGNGIATRYGHLSEIAMKSGQMVEAGTVVGLVGSTGRSTGPHLHYETRLSGTAVDPMRFLRVGAKLFAPPGKHDQLLQIIEAPIAELPDD